MNTKQIKKLLLSSFVLLVFFGYALHDNLGRLLGRDIIPPLAAPNQSPTSQTTPSIKPTIPAAGTNPKPGSSVQARYKDGTYKGNSFDVFYGNVQVEAVIANGKISDIKFLDYPRDRSTSIEISNQAMPLLTAEAIQAQSAQVDGVSGATQTSEGFVKSLESALLQART